MKASIACAGVLRGTKLVPVWDSYRKKERHVLPVLMFGQADTPFRAAWALTCGHSGRSGCDACSLRSTRCGPDGQEYSFNVYGGYTVPAPTLAFGEDAQWKEPGEVLLGEGMQFIRERMEGLIITSKMHQLRSRAADEAREEETQRFPLPAGAAGGGNLAADPNSAEEKALSKGTCESNCIIVPVCTAHMLYRAVLVQPGCYAL